MKPKTKLQMEIVNGSRKLAPVSEAQKRYAYKHCFVHYFKRDAKGNCFCLDCGHTWQWINRMNEKINRMWKYDMLTQVLNRSGFFYCAETILQKIKEEKSNAFIIFLDIDGLKSVNDNLGHEIGDAFIAKIAGQIFTAGEPVEITDAEESC